MRICLGADSSAALNAGLLDLLVEPGGEQLDNAEGWLDREVTAVAEASVSEPMTRRKHWLALATPRYNVGRRFLDATKRGRD